VDIGWIGLRLSARQNVTADHRLQVWLLASTLIATALFGLMLWNNRRGELPIRSIRFEGVLLIMWWITLLGACAYAYMEGMGG
jgi:hypothetical protein